MREGELAGWSARGRAAKKGNLLIALAESQSQAQAQVVQCWVELFADFPLLPILNSHVQWSMGNIQ